MSQGLTDVSQKLEESLRRQLQIFQMWQTIHSRSQPDLSRIVCIICKGKSYGKDHHVLMCPMNTFRSFPPEPQRPEKP